MGCTIGVPGLRSGGVSQEVDQELSKMDGARASKGQKSPSWVQGQSQLTEAKCKNRVHIFTFSCKTFLNFINTGAELGQYFCAYTIKKTNLRFNGGFEPP